MATSKTIKFNGVDITVKELTLQDVNDLANGTEQTAAGTMAELLKRSAGLTRAKVMKFTPSDLQTLVDAMVEVNGSFLSQAREIGLEEAAAHLEKMFKGVFCLPFLK